MTGAEAIDNGQTNGMPALHQIVRLNAYWAPSFEVNQIGTPRQQLAKRQLACMLPDPQKM